MAAAVQCNAEPHRGDKESYQELPEGGDFKYVIVDLRFFEGMAWIWSGYMEKMVERAHNREGETVLNCQSY